MIKLQDVTDDKCWPFSVSLGLFLSPGTGAWNDVSMEDLQSCIMNQDDSRFFQDLPLRSERRNIHVEVSFLSTQRDVKVFDRLTLSFFFCHSFFLYLRRHHNWDKKLTTECGHFEEWVSDHPAGIFAVQQYRDGNTPTFIYVCCPTVNKSSHDEIEICELFFGGSTLKVLYTSGFISHWFHCHCYIFENKNDFIDQLIPNSGTRLNKSPQIQKHILPYLSVFFIIIKTFHQMLWSRGFMYKYE